MAKTTQLVLSLKSKVGVLAGISRTLADARVNILSLSAAEAAGRGKIRMVVSNPQEKHLPAMRMYLNMQVRK